MKTLSNKILVWVVNIFFFGTILIAVLITGVYAWKEISGRPEENFFVQFKTGTYFKIDQSEAVVKVVDEQIDNPLLVTNSLSVNFNTKNSVVRIFLIGSAILMLGYYLLMLFVVRKIVLSTRHETPFVEANVFRLRMLGIMLLLIEPLSWLGKTIMLRNLSTYVEVEFFKKSYDQLSLGVPFQFFSTWIIAGVLVLVLAEIFRSGIALRNESELTI
ncbi:MAG: DUF2975 domain-containing protein [Cyclobacteriaceae bacterium]|nr:DUF2975 domain-containing protein [Cyclobacteriaceae bacterium]